MKRFIVTAAAIAAVVSLAGCSTPASTAADGKQQVKIGILNSAPPLTYIDNGKPAGFEVELLNAVATKENWDIDYKYMNFDAMIPAMQSQSVDGAAAGFFVTDERKKAVSFTDSYYSDGNTLVANLDSPVKDVSDLKGKVIVAKKGASGAPAAQKAADQVGASVLLLQDEPAMWLALENGTAAALVSDASIIAYKNTQTGSKLNVVKKLDESPVAVAFEKNSPRVEEFNAALKQLTDDGTLKMLKDKYQMSR